LHEKRHETVEAAALAAKAREPARKKPAPQELTKRPLDKRRQPLALTQRRGLPSAPVRQIRGNPAHSGSALQKPRGDSAA
jgi:hypothetical protein